MSSTIRRTVNRLARSEVEACLNWGGFATYDHESTGDLREALVLAIEAGDIELSTVEAAGEVAL